MTRKTSTWFWTHSEGSKGTLSDFRNCYMIIIFLVHLHDERIDDRASDNAELKTSGEIERLAKQKDQHVPKAKGFTCCPVTLFLHDVHYRECPVEGHHLCHLLLVAVGVSTLRSFSKLCLLASIEEINKPPLSLGICMTLRQAVVHFCFSWQRSYKTEII